MARLEDIRGSGLGLKRALIPQIQSLYGDPSLGAIQFIEIAPENWLGAHGRYKKELAWFAERYPLVCHGLCLSLGGPDPLNVEFLRQVKGFLNEYDIPLYTEHLSYCTDTHDGQAGYLYDLLPIPMTEEALHYVVQRILQTQDILGKRIAIENASFYVNVPISTMTEIDFLNAVLTEADCWLHLDINNVYVNSVNFDFDPYVYLDKLPAERIVYGHMAGHYQEAPNLLIDTHAADVIEPVWQLLDAAYTKFGSFPTLLERDSEIPPIKKLMAEVDRIAEYQSRHHGPPLWNENEALVASC